MASNAVEFQATEAVRTKETKKNTLFNRYLAISQSLEGLVLFSNGNSESSFTRFDFEAVKGFWVSDVDGDGCDDILLL